MPNSFSYSRIVYFKKECQIRVFFKEKILSEKNGTNRNGISKSSIGIGFVDMSIDQR